MVIQSLIKVSNNSLLTQQIFNVLNEKLTDKEKRDFELWLRVVETNTEQQVRKNKFKM